MIRLASLLSTKILPKPNHIAIANQFTVKLAIYVVNAVVVYSDVH